MGVMQFLSSIQRIAFLNTPFKNTSEYRIDIAVGNTGLPKKNIFQTINNYTKIVPSLFLILATASGMWSFLYGYHTVRYVSILFH